MPAKAVKAVKRSTTRTAAGLTTATVVVRSGDTVGGIAAAHGTTVAAVLKLNHLRAASLLQIGQRLRVPTRQRFSADTFEGRTYASAVVRAAARNRAVLADRSVPSRAATRALVERTARRYGVDPALAVAVAVQESGLHQRQVSVANAIGVMQVIPSSGRWAETLVGRHLDLLDTGDNVTAGVVILKSLLRSADTRAHAIAGYYQGLGSVQQHGMFADTKRYVASIERLASGR
ncbi:hypothetical protein GCM10025868_43710 [Angustibacter aerolatus]|uniref:LysM domain-containing protein n=1 Tax=Angustibacter aerolatus TaxID=1162965 RepID=A0ABQ6JR13_9ACTN|nr:transglycosylase SLT domain-containing protein [Angustibacter aerolatus]GMA89121.1 hypothetical protein GCM10025868_43710 [Angustibacter aerolatus]